MCVCIVCMCACVCNVHVCVHVCVHVFVHVCTVVVKKTSHIVLVLLSGDYSKLLNKRNLYRHLKSVN